MLEAIHGRKGLQLTLGFLLGIGFGFLLQRGGATRFDVIIGQLLFEDFTVVKIMLSAVLAGMVGVHALRSLGLARLHPKPGSMGSIVPGGLIFGLGFGILGYCPGTAAGAVGQGSLDALFGGILGILIGAGIFAAAYPALRKPVLERGDFGARTIPEILRLNAWVVVAVVSVAIFALLYFLERSGV
ncbi:MAG: YeeE/YedE family protein [Acidobacteria bacterium]|nr:YeeE/YedE family protein [Acidobacteriota bacterium]